MNRPLDAEAIIARLEEGGDIAGRIPQYECRREQLDLARLVIQSFNENTVCVAEAGTGVGKSFAYLLPALFFALETGERVVVSTATINLQQQLYDKDVPFLRAALGEAGSGIKTALVKGRGNFVCRRRLREASEEVARGLFSEDEHDQMRRIEAWAGESASGEKSELPFLPSPALWQQVASESDSCMGAGCAERENCFVMANRRRAEAARLVVVNHHVLLADLAARHETGNYDTTVVLPPCRRIVLDEAHHIEDSATSFFSRTLSRTTLARRIGRLYRRRGALESGLLPQLRAAVPSADAGAGDEAFWGAAAGLTEKILETLDELDAAGLSLCGGTSAFRFIPQRNDIIEAHLVPPLRNLRSLLAALAAHIGAVLKRCGDEEDDEGQGAARVWELRAGLRHLQMTEQVCAAFIEYEKNAGTVFWIERRAARRQGQKDWALWTAAPLAVGPVLNDALFTPHKTVVCVSATLGLGGSFDYWLERAGLAGREDVLRGTFASPFPYKQAVLLAIPADAPPPSSPAYQGFVNDAALRLCTASGGGALVLFTSYGSLRAAFSFCAPRLARHGICALAQGEDDRARLMRRFLDDASSVLFATDSFWEGIDAPGETLRLVILCRLPFNTPDDPVPQARCEALERAGKNPFTELSVPEAVMKFRQGFGRLMRRASDRGVVAVLDNRLAQKSYGRIFLDALPETRRCVDSFEVVERVCEQFLNM